MKNVNFLIAFILLFSTNLFAQYSTDWIRPSETYQKNGVMIARDNYDNVISTGYWTANNAFTRKYNKFGVLQWEAVSASGIPSQYEKPVWVTTDNNNNVYVAGYRYAYSGSSTALAIFILKYDAEGTQLWKKVVSPVSYLVDMNLRCEVDNNGKLYVGAAVVGSIPGFALIKLDTDGTILFTQHSSTIAVRNFHGMRLVGSRVVITGEGGSPLLAPVAVWDTTGTLLWETAVQGRSGTDVEMDDAGNVYVITGYDNQVSPTSGMDMIVYKFGPSGTQLWKKDYDFGVFDFPSRATLVNNKLSIIGYSQISGFDWITLQVNTDGNMLWNTRYNGAPGFDEAPYFIAAKANGEVFVTGKGGPNVDPNNVPSLRMITLKYDNAGAVKWIDSVNIYSGWGLACTLASDNSLYALGGTAMTVFHFLDHTGTGTCNTPTGLTVANIANNQATFSWTPVAGATLYHLRYKPTTSASWTVVSYEQPTINIFGLYTGTTYEYAVEAICTNGPSGYSAAQTFTTTGTAVCASSGQSQAQEYFSQLWIQGGIINNSGSNNGYGDFTHVILPFTRNQNVQGYLSGMVPYPEYEYYKIWIDYNHDNDFTDVGEEVVSLYSDFSGFITFNFTVPPAAPLGTARMRVIMSHDSEPVPCGVYARGETEDYTVFINDTSTVPPPVPAGLSVSNITYSSATFTWTPENSAASYRLRYKKATENTWTIAPVNVTSITVPALSSNTDYIFGCEAIGGIGSSGYGAPQSFRTLAVALPVVGIDLTARRQGDNVLLSWTTQSEQNSARFDVERSIDGITWMRAGQVQAAGNSTALRNYRVTDIAVDRSMLYYRIKIVSADGSSTLSEIRVVAKAGADIEGFLLYPNPTVSTVNITLAEVSDKEIVMQVINALGQVVNTKTIGRGTQLVKLDISQFKKGVYFVKLTGNEFVQVKKLVVR